MRKGKIEKGILAGLFINPTKTEEFLIGQFDQLVQDNLELENNQKRLTKVLERAIRMLERLSSKVEELGSREAASSFRLMKLEKQGAGGK